MTRVEIIIWLGLANLQDKVLQKSLRWAVSISPDIRTTLGQPCMALWACLFFHMSLDTKRKFRKSTYYSKIHLIIEFSMAYLFTLCKGDSSQISEIIRCKTPKICSPVCSTTAVAKLYQGNSPQNDFLH